VQVFDMLRPVRPFGVGQIIRVKISAIVSHWKQARALHARASTDYKNEP